MSDMLVDYEAKARFKDSTGQIRIINRKSKKGGENLRKAAVSMETMTFRSWLHGLKRDMVQYFYDNGLHDRVITNRRLDYIDSKGKFGISRTEALEWYKFIYSFLSPEQLKNRNKTYDLFTDKELGLEDNKDVEKR